MPWAAIHLAARGWGLELLLRHVRIGLNGLESLVGRLKRMG